MLKLTRARFIIHSAKELDWRRLIAAILDRLAF